MAQIDLPETIEEPTVEFKTITERGIYKIVNEELKETMVEISGYDLQVNFNMKYLNTVEEIEAACQGIASLFREIIMEKLLENRKQEV